MDEDDQLPPKPNCTFDFRLPHSIESGENGLSSDSHLELLDHLDQAVDHDTEDSMKGEKRNGTNQSHPSLPQISIRDVGNEPKSRLPTPPHSGGLPEGRKSPRDIGDDAGEQNHAKKPRLSLFGDPARDRDQSLTLPPKEHSLPATPLTPHNTIGNGLSLLDINQKDDTEAIETIQNGFLQSPLHSNDHDSVMGSISPRRSPALSEESFVIPQDHELYFLRKGIDRNKSSTWVDADRSGNYDPAAEARQNAERLKAAKAARKKKRSKERTKKEPIPKCIAKLPVPIGMLRNITDGAENWPDNWSEPDDQFEREKEEWRALYRDTTPGVKRQDPIVDPLDKNGDLTGRPSARGCVDCYKSRTTCPMVGGAAWPCKHCTEKGVECELLKRPNITGGRCTACDEAGEHRCSFEDGDEGICTRCMVEQKDCEIKIPDGYTYPRVDITKIMYSPDRPFVACTHCRQHKLKCSLKKKTDVPPCKNCRKNGSGCTFYDFPTTQPQPISESRKKQKKKRKGDATKRDVPPESKTLGVYTPGADFFSAQDLADLEEQQQQEEDNQEAGEPAREETPEFEMEDIHGRKGKLKKISTSFAHPIHFATDPHDMTSCNFCENPIFSMVGHWEREIHALEWDNRLGFTEMGGGHCENEGPTAMCRACTLERAQTVCCSGHQLRPINHQVPIFDKAFDDLLCAQTSTEISEQLKRWCSMCFSPAAFTCTTQQYFLADGENDVMIDGCGLRLCATCNLSLRMSYSGDSKDMAMDLDSEPKPKEDDVDGKVRPPRADVGFLTENGLLMRNVEAALAQMDEVNEE